MAKKKYSIEVTTKHTHESEKYSIFYGKNYGDHNGGARGAKTKKELLEVLRIIIKHWNEYDGILGRKSDPVTAKNLEFKCCIKEITKEQIIPPKVKSKKKNYPSRRPESAAVTDKYLWINGVSWLRDIIIESQAKVNGVIRDIQSEKRHLTTKKVNGHDYWYLWMDGVWKSKGRVDEGKDYPVELDLRIMELKKDIREIADNLSSIVVAEIGNGHYIINSRKHLDKRHDVIPLKKFYPYIDQVPDSGTDKKAAANYPSGSCCRKNKTDKTLFLTYCSAKKTDASTGTPEEIYTGTRIKGFISKCKKDNLLWGILSARYGVILPNRVIETYDLSLDSYNPAEYSWFTDQVVDQLILIRDKFKISKVVFFKPSPKRGEAYLKVLQEVIYDGVGNLELVITQSIKDYPFSGLGHGISADKRGVE